MSDTRSNSPLVKYLSVLALPMLAAVLVYANTLGGGFVHDDTSQILENPWVKDLGKLPSAIANPVWAFKYTSPTNYYRPVQMGLYNLLWAVADGAAWPFHALNVFLHTLNTMLFGVLVLRLSRNTALAMAASLLFAVNPINTEAVAWIACLPELTYGVFSFAAILVHVSIWTAPAGKTLWRRAAAAALFGLAVFSKETAATLVGSIFILELVVRPARESRAQEKLLWRNALIGVVPYVGAMVGYLFVRLAVVGGIAPRGRAGRTALDAIINAPPLLASYLLAVLAPLRQSAHHLFHPLESMLNLAFLGPLAAVLSMVALLWWLARRRPELTFAGALFFLPLLPVLYVPAIGCNVFAERYLYIPSAGVMWLVVAGGAWLAARVLNERRAGALLVIASILLAIPAAAATIARNATWHDNVSFATALIRDEPGTFEGHLILGNEYLSRAELEKALAAYENGLRFVPNSPELEANVIGVSVELGRVDPETAVDRFRALTARAPTSIHAQFGLAYVYLRLGRLAEAAPVFESVLELLPVADAAFLGLAVIDARQGNDRAAVEHCRSAIRIDPRSASAYQQMGVSLLRLGNLAESTTALETAVALNPNDAGAHARLGAVHLAAGRLEKARRSLEKALALDPGHASARQNLDRLRQLSGSGSP